MEKLQDESIQVPSDVPMLVNKPDEISIVDNQNVETKLNEDTNKVGNVEERSEEGKVTNHVEELLNAGMSSDEATPDKNNRQDNVKITDENLGQAKDSREGMNKLGNDVKQTVPNDNLSSLSSIPEADIAGNNLESESEKYPEAKRVEEIKLDNEHNTVAAEIIDAEMLPIEANEESNNKIKSVAVMTEPEKAKDCTDVSTIVPEKIIIQSIEKIGKPTEIEKAEQSKDAEMMDEPNTESKVEDCPEVSANVANVTILDSVEEPNLILSSESPISSAPTIPIDQSSPFLIHNTNNTTFSSLSLLAQYDSDSDIDNNDDVVDVTGQYYRNQTIEVKSESSSDSSDSDVEYLSEVRKEINKSLVADAENSDEDDDYDGDENNTNAPPKKRTPPKVKGELLLDDLPPIEDLHITVPEEVCIELGKVHSIVGQLVLVNTKPNSLLLDLETILFLNKGKNVLGEIFDVLGQVADPLYCVRFNSNEQIHEKGIKIGDTVYVAPETEHTQFVILSSIMKMKGSDASWENDIEPPPRYLDYSDDEEERVARARLRNNKRTVTGETIVVDDESDTDGKNNPSQSNFPNKLRNPAFRRHRPNPVSNNPGNNFAQYRYNNNHPNSPTFNNQANDSWHNNYAPRRSNYRPRAPYQNYTRHRPMAPMYNPYGGIMPPSQLQMPQNSSSPSNLPPRGFPPQ